MSKMSTLMTGFLLFNEKIECYVYDIMY